MAPTTNRCHLLRELRITNRPPKAYAVYPKFEEQGQGDTGRRETKDQASPFAGDPDVEPAKNARLFQGA